MTKDELAAIRNRDSAGSGVLDGTNRLIDGGLQCFKDRRALLAYLDELRPATERTTPQTPEIDCAEDCLRWGATPESCYCRQRRRANENQP